VVSDEDAPVECHKSLIDSKNDAENQVLEPSSLVTRLW
jgi:hypothetical protein